MRRIPSLIGQNAAWHGVEEWRKRQSLTNKVYKRFQKVRSPRTAKRHPRRIKDYPKLCRTLVARAEESLAALSRRAPAQMVGKLPSLIGHAHRQIDQTDRRLLKGEEIPHGEKVFSILEPHTRRIRKGKAVFPVELGGSGLHRPGLARPDPRHVVM